MGDEVREALCGQIMERRVDHCKGSAQLPEGFEKSDTANSCLNRVSVASALKGTEDERGREQAEQLGG